MAKEVSYVKNDVTRVVEHNEFHLVVDEDTTKVIKDEVLIETESNDFQIGKNQVLGNIIKEDIDKTFEDKNIQADSKCSTEVSREIIFEHNLTDDQLERE